MRANCKESTETLKQRVKDLENTLEQAEKRRSDELRSELLRVERRQWEDVSAAQRATRQAEQDKLATEKTMVELRAQFENTRRYFETSAADASSLTERMREKCASLELELELTMSKASLLDIEAGRSEGRARAAEERVRLLSAELQSSLAADCGSRARVRADAV